MNPYRKHRRRPGDYILVAVALAATLALLVWAIHG